jgi:hypothetical protein
VAKQQQIDPATFYCTTCYNTISKTYKDDTGTQFYNCPKCGVIPNTKITLTEPPQRNPKEPKTDITILQHINEIENPKHSNKPVTIQAVISSTSTAYTIPSIIKAVLKEDDQENAAITPAIPIDASVNLSLIAVTQETQNNRLKKYLKTKQPNTEIFITQTLKHRTIYSLRVRPPIVSLEKIGEKLIDDKGYEYKHLDIYVVSDTQLNFQPSTLIQLTGKPLPNPKTQKTTFLSYKTEFIEDNLSFDQNKLYALKIKFQNKSVKEQLNWITNNFERYSHVVGRQNIAKAALLSYFTPLHISFNKQLQRGWGIITVVGDTTTGKSETVKKLSRLLKTGMVLSAETASTVGLTGTAQQTDRDGWFIDWGFLPLMDRKLLAVDGCHKLGASCWAALAEAERSGVLSIAKAAKNQTYARTRQIKIYNPVDQEATRYSTKSLASFLHPVQSLKTILDPTSIARIDLCVFSDQRDVSAKLINKKIIDDPEPELEYLSECLKWAWSGKAKVEWVDVAVDLLLSKAIDLHNMFFLEDIPLVSVDVKYKIARLSEALAYCTLSTNDDLSVVTVTEEHVTSIADFLIEEYTNAGLGVLAQEQKFEKLSLQKVQELILTIHAQLSNYSIELEVLIEILGFIVKQNRTTLDELKTKFNLTDNKQARPLTAILKTEGLLTSKNGYYPTAKLIDSYKVTGGFTNLSGLSDLSALKKNPQPINCVNEEQKTVSINTKGSNFEIIKPVKPLTPTTFINLKKNELKNYFNTADTEETKNAKISTSYPKEETSSDYSQLVCAFCQKEIMENDWLQDDFTWGKPAHKSCYEEKRNILSAQDSWETDR